MTVYLPELFVVLITIGIPIELTNDVVSVVLDKLKLDGSLQILQHRRLQHIGPSRNPDFHLYVK